MEWVYKGKFKDRSPYIRAAGAPLKQTGTFKNCIQIYPVDDAIETVLAEAGLHKIPLNVTPQRMVNSRHVGVYTGVRGALSPPIESRYNTLLRDLRETTWETYWTKQLGKSKDPTGALPTSIKADHTFGSPLKRDNPSLVELVNPSNVTPYEVAFNEAEYHKMYSRTHNNYYPGEQLSREYDEPYDRGQRYGSFPRRHATAICTMKAKYDGPTAIASKILSDHTYRTRFQLGRPLTPNDNINCVEPGHRFGKKSKRDFHNLADLMATDRHTSVARKDFYVWLGKLNEVRWVLCKRHTDFRQLYGLCQYADVDYREWLDLAVFQQILLDQHLPLPYDDILPLARIFGVCRDDLVHYGKMLDLINLKVELPSLSMLTEPSGCEFITTTQVDRYMAPSKDNSCLPAAGCARRDCLPTDLVNLGSETVMGTLINPSIFTNYSLSHVDLFMPRSKEYIRKLFERLGYTFPDDSFDKLWSIGQERDKKNEVSVDTFKQIMDKAAPITIYDEIDEDDCKKVARKCT